jgi:membrane protein YdbS with pleckstrin-like domain
MTNGPEERTPALPPMTTEPQPVPPPTAEQHPVPAPVATPGTDATTALDASSGEVSSAPESSGVLDRDTYDRIREPRSSGRLPLGDGTWHQLARQYVWVQLISTGVVAVIVLAAVLFLTLVWGQWWAWIPGGVFLAILVWTLVITPRQARAYGYQLRRDDLVFRRGILWQRVVAVPYGRMQLVDITHGPLDRGFGIAQLKLVTAAASTNVVIPGLRQEAAELLRDTLVDVAEARRTGL